MNIQFIARNIPTPNKRNNDVIIKIASFLNKKHNVFIMMPKEFVPFGVHLFSKYKHLFKLKDYSLGDFRISVRSYIRLPLRNVAFLLLKPVKLNREVDVMHAHYIFPDGLIAKELARTKGIPFVVSVRQSDWFLLQKVNKSSNTYGFLGHPPAML